MAAVIRRPIVWAQAAVIICAYCAYKGLDNYSLYAVQVLGMDEVEGARFMAYATYIRPAAAVAAGFISDRFSAARTTGVTFLILTASYIALAVAAPTPSWLPVIYANIVVSFFAVFGLRGVYFALLQETRTPAHLTGTTVGMVSFIGYTPEIFFASIAGRILDHTPGVEGHQNYFKFLACIAFVGLLVVVWLMWLNRRRALSIAH
jgi:sugar phosphate permease